MLPRRFPCPQQEPAVNIPPAFNADTIGAMQRSIGLLAHLFFPVWERLAGIGTRTITVSFHLHIVIDRNLALKIYDAT